VNDLLSALSEKELTIESLQKSLDSLSQNKNSQAETKTRNEREEEEMHSPRPGFDKDMLTNLKLPDLTLTPLTRNVAPLT